MELVTYAYEEKAVINKIFPSLTSHAFMGIPLPVQKLIDHTH
jgi:hypothetical protein